MAEHAQQLAGNRIEEAKLALARKWALISLTGKIPVHKGWSRSTVPTLKTVERWLRQGRNLGVRTGGVSGIVVIDDDSLDGSASAALDLPTTVTAITGSGRRHVYFRAPGFKVGNSVKTVAPGIDIRGDGGQVVLVGSLHPATGKPYCWAPGLSPADVEFAELPEHILAKLRKPTKTATKLKLVTDPTSPITGDDVRLRAYVRAAFDGEIDRVYASTEGTRNQSLNKAAFALGQFVGAGALDREHARRTLHAAAVAVGLTDTEAAATTASGLDAGMKEPRDLASVLTKAGAHHGADEDDDRPVIVLHPGRLPNSVTKAERTLLRQRPPLIYQRGTTLVRIVLLPEAGAGRSIRTKALIYEVTSNFLIDKLTELIAWNRIDPDNGKLRPTDCPERIALTLLSRSGAWNVPPLIGVIDCPTLRADGGILAMEGYDRDSGLYVALGNREWPEVPASPSRDDALRALQKLSWLVKDFPFVERADLSVALAAVLTALVRPSVRTAPLIAFRASKMGSGKTLLADVVSLVATGRSAAVMAQGADENEDKKRMLPLLGEGDPVAVIDNIERPFGSAALCSILTQPTWRDRVLGKSQTLTLPTTNTTWLATGNNIVFVGDITTRVLVCDLDPKCERPEERTFEVNLHHYVPQHREELVVAGLTILRAYHVAGRPSMGLSTFGRFEEWSDWIRSALVWLGLDDPCETRRRVEETDPVRAELTNLLLLLRAKFGDRTFRVADVLGAQVDDPALREVLGPILAAAGAGQGHAQRLGLFFAYVHRRPEGGLRLVRGPNRAGAGTWGVEHV